MALIRPAVSKLTRQAFVNGLADFSALRYPGEAPCWQLYTLGLHDIAGGAGIGAAKPVAWRFLVDDALGRTVAGDVTDMQEAGTWQMTSMSHGADTGDALRAASEVEDLAQVQARNYELRTLTIPGLLIQALWLKSQEGGDDLVFPFQALAKQLQLRHPYTMDEFMYIIKPLAAKRLEFGESHGS